MYKGWWNGQVVALKQITGLNPIPSKRFGTNLSLPNSSGSLDTSYSFGKYNTFQNPKNTSKSNKPLLPEASGVKLRGDSPSFDSSSDLGEERRNRFKESREIIPTYRINSNTDKGKEKEEEGEELPIPKRRVKSKSDIYVDALESSHNKRMKEELVCRKNAEKHAEPGHTNGENGESIGQKIAPIGNIRPPKSDNTITDDIPTASRVKGKAVRDVKPSEAPTESRAESTPKNLEDNQEKEDVNMEIKALKQGLTVASKTMLDTPNIQQAKSQELTKCEDSLNPQPPEARTSLRSRIPDLGRERSSVSVRDPTPVKRSKSQGNPLERLRKDPGVIDKKEGSLRSLLQKREKSLFQEKKDEKAAIGSVNEHDEEKEAVDSLYRDFRHEVFMMKYSSST